MIVRQRTIEQPGSNVDEVEPLFSNLDVVITGRVADVTGTHTSEQSTLLLIQLF